MRQRLLVERLGFGSGVVRVVEIGQVDERRHHPRVERQRAAVGENRGLLLLVVAAIERRGLGEMTRGGGKRILRDRRAARHHRVARSAAPRLQPTPARPADTPIPPDRKGRRHARTRPQRHHLGGLSVGPGRLEVEGELSGALGDERPQHRAERQPARELRARLTDHREIGEPVQRVLTRLAMRDRTDQAPPFQISEVIVPQRRIQPADRARGVERGARIAGAGRHQVVELVLAEQPHAARIACVQLQGFGHAPFVRRPLLGRRASTTSIVVSRVTAVATRPS